MGERLHAEQNPNGCGGARGMCEACAKRLDAAFVTCPACGNTRVQVIGGKISGHTRMVGGRRNYRARPQECEGSGMRL